MSDKVTAATCPQCKKPLLEAIIDEQPISADGTESGVLLPTATPTGWEVRQGFVEHVCPDVGRNLHDLCAKFIDEQRITCPEAVYQTDRVIENAYQFIEQVCELVGYKDEEDEG